MCRIDDILIDEKPDFKVLKDNEIPEQLETIFNLKTHKGILVLQMNCRSILNKMEELIMWPTSTRYYMLNRDMVR